MAFCCSFVFVVVVVTFVEIVLVAVDIVVFVFVIVVVIVVVEINIVVVIVVVDIVVADIVVVVVFRVQNVVVIPSEFSVVVEVLVGYEVMRRSISDLSSLQNVLNIVFMTIINNFRFVFYSQFSLSFFEHLHLQSIGGESLRIILHLGNSCINHVRP